MRKLKKPDENNHKFKIKKLYMKVHFVVGRHIWKSGQIAKDSSWVRTRERDRRRGGRVSREHQ